MPTIITISTEEVRALYATKKFSMQQIADHFGVSRQAILYHLQRKPKKPIPVRCDGCGKEFGIQRKRGRLKKFFYCSDACRPAPKAVWEELAKEILE